MSRSATVKKPALRAQALDRGREFLRKQGWAEAVVHLTAADAEGPLDPFDLVELAKASLLIGKDREGGELLARAHQAFLSTGETQLAARCAFWLGFNSLLNGNLAVASGWLSRAERLLDEHPDCVERGYLFLPVGYRLAHSGEGAKAYAAFLEAATIGERFGDADLTALARQGQGRALIRQGEISRGVALLDEAMISVTAGEVSPLTAGGVYCSVLDACGEIFDLRRAQEWTSALERWCAAQPDMVPYRGHCRIRRAEILQLHGAWQAAFDEAQQACQKLSERTPRPETGAAFYRLGELYRLRGEFESAEEAYREASAWQRTGQPGLALLRLAQGHADAASAVIRRIMDEVHEYGSRARVLDAFVEIMVAVNDVVAARSGADELSVISQRYDAPLLHSTSSRANGVVLLAEGEARRAMSDLRRSWEIWCELDAPYEAARTQVFMAQACAMMDDCDAARLELELACEVFQKLGAAHDFSRTRAISARTIAKGESPLTAREVEVLKLIASGKTNRGIATALNISEKTVARHVSNIFNKLDLSSRAAATAFAYENQLV